MYGIFQWMPYLLLRINLQVVTFKTVTFALIKLGHVPVVTQLWPFVLASNYWIFIMSLLISHWSAPGGAKWTPSPDALSGTINMSVVCSYVCGRGLLISLPFQHRNTECIFQKGGNMARIRSRKIQTRADTLRVNRPPCSLSVTSSFCVDCVPVLVCLYERPSQDVLVNSTCQSVLRWTDFCPWDMIRRFSRRLVSE